MIWINRRKCGLSVEKQLKLLEHQDYKCAICGQKFFAPSDCRLNCGRVTNMARGFLCRSCNRKVRLLDFKYLEPTVSFGEYEDNRIRKFIANPLAAKFYPPTDTLK